MVSPPADTRISIPDAIAMLADARKQARAGTDTAETQEALIAIISASTNAPDSRRDREEGRAA